MTIVTPERNLEEALVRKLQDLKYEYRSDIRDRATLEANFREKFEALNRVTLILRSGSFLNWKTLTATLLKSNESIHKCLFVVDRRDTSLEILLVGSSIRQQYARTLKLRKNTTRLQG